MEFASLIPRVYSPDQMDKDITDKSIKKDSPKDKKFSKSDNINSFNMSN